MKNRQRISCSSFGALILVAANGAWAGDLVWTEDVVEQIPIRADWYRSLEVETHNGSIGLVAVSDGSGESYVIVTKRGGGYTKGAADRAVEQIEIVIKEDKDQLEIGWKWGANRKKTHETIVSFEFHVPGKTDFEATTHNGPISISGATGEVELETHNGPIDVLGASGPLKIETHNGGVTVVYTGEKIEVETHNGAQVIDLAGCGEVGGSLETFNGAVKLLVGDATSMKLKCETKNGAIQCDVPLTDESVSDHKLKGTIGDGGATLKISTRNGSVRIVRAG